MILHDTQSDNVEAALIIFVAMVPSFLLKIIIFSDVIGKRNCSIVRRCIGEQIKWVQSWCKESNTVALGLLGGRKGIRPVKISATCLQRGKPTYRGLSEKSLSTWRRCWCFCVAPCVANKLEAKWHMWLLAAWLSCSTLVSITEVTLHRAWLVLGWVTIYGRVNHLSLWPATQANSAFYPQRNGKWVLAKVWWHSAAGE